MRRAQIRPKRSRLKRCEPGSRSGKRDVRRGLALEHLPYENELSTLIPVTDTIADHALAEHGRELRREVAHLIRVRILNQVQLGVFYHLLQCHPISIRRICFE